MSIAETRELVALGRASRTRIVRTRTDDSSTLAIEYETQAGTWKEIAIKGDAERKVRLDMNGGLYRYPTPEEKAAWDALPGAKRS